MTHTQSTRSRLQPQHPMPPFFLLLIWRGVPFSLKENSTGEKGMVLNMALDLRSRQIEAGPKQPCRAEESTTMRAVSRQGAGQQRARALPGLPRHGASIHPSLPAAAPKTEQPHQDSCRCQEMTWLESRAPPRRAGSFIQKAFLSSFRAPDSPLLWLHPGDSGWLEHTEIPA